MDLIIITLLSLPLRKYLLKLKIIKILQHLLCVAQSFINNLYPIRRLCAILKSMIKKDTYIHSYIGMSKVRFEFIPASNENILVYNNASDYICMTLKNSYLELPANP